MLAPQMRVVHLTPMFPLAIPTDDERSVECLLSVQGRVYRYHHASGRHATTPLGDNAPCNPLGIAWTPKSRKDSSLSHHSQLTAAITITCHFRVRESIQPKGSIPEPIPRPARFDKEGIYVKFSQQYSSALHGFCAERGLAPKLLGFERLTGGWFGLAMEKVDIIEPWKIRSFSELKTWKKAIRTLVDDFHQEGLVHGDLRLANLIFTKD